MGSDRARAWRALRVGGIGALWMLTAILMLRDYGLDPPDPAVIAAHPYGHNYPGTLELGLGASFVELVVVYLILRPVSYRRSWGRSLAALVLLLPWSAWSLFMVMHAGGIFALHFLWVACLLVIVTASLVVSGVASIRARSRAP
jgi:hypothetical protein